MNWLIFGALAALALAIVAAPFLMQSRQIPPATDSGPTGDQSNPRPGRRRPTTPQLIVAAVVLLVLVSAAILYSRDSSPVMSPQGATPPTSTGATATTGLPDVDTMIDRLARRLQTSPNDPEGWRMLGWSYFATGRYAESVSAYARAAAQSPTNAAVQSAYGEALVKANGDRVTAQAEAVFHTAVRLDAHDERARIYLARLRHERGESRAALDDLFAILAASAPDSPTASTLRQTIRQVAEAAHIDITGRLPAEPAASAASAPAATGASPGASSAAPATDGATATTAQDQAAMIDGMVARLEARLAASPRDADGWIMLMRSRKRLGQDDQARTALQHGLEAFSGDAPTQDRLRQAARDLDVR